MTRTAPFDRLIVGTAAERAALAASSYPDLWFREKDTGALYFSDGVTWQSQVSPTGTYASMWRSGVIITVGQQVTYGGTRWQATTAHTTGAYFDRTKWFSLPPALPGMFAPAAAVSWPTMIVPQGSLMGVQPSPANPGQYTIVLNRFQVAQRQRLRYVNSQIGTVSGNIQAFIAKLSQVAAGGSIKGQKVMDSGLFACPTGAFQKDLGPALLPPGDYGACLWGDNATYTILYNLNALIGSARLGGTHATSSAGVNLNAGNVLCDAWNNHAVYGLTVEDGPLAAGEVAIPITSYFTQVTPVAGSPAYQSFPDVTRLTDGSLFGVWRAGVTHLTIDGVIMASRSYDEGVTWTPPVQIIASAGNDCRTGGVLQLDNGDIIVSYFVGTSGATDSNWVAISTDNGSTFGTPISVPSAQANPACGQHPVIQLSDGSLRFTSYGGSGTASIITSTDRGRTWSGEVTIAAYIGGSGTAYLEPTILQPAGTSKIIALMRTQATGPVYSLTQSTSTDNGATWSAVSTVSTTAGQSPASMIQVASGTIIALTRGISAQAMGNMAVIFTSTNNGTSWGTERLFDGDPTAPMYEYAGLVETTVTGDVCVLYSMETTTNTAAHIRAKVLQVA